MMISQYCRHTPAPSIRAGLFDLVRQQLHVVALVRRCKNPLWNATWIRTIPNAAPRLELSAGVGIEKPLRQLHTRL